jgi:O-antigen/teichoic acid export membrane protein
MNRSLKSLISLTSQSVVYGIGFFGRQLVVYLTLPLITNLVPRGDFGIISIVTSFYTVINTLTNVGLPSATFRYYNDDIDVDKRRKVIGTSQALFFFLALILALLIIFFAGTTSQMLLGDSKYSLVIQIVALLLVIETMNYYGTILLRLHNRPGAVGIHSLVSVIGQMGLAIIFIKFLDWGVIGYWAGFLMGSIIGLILIVWLNRKWIRFDFSATTAKELLAYGIPLIPASFSISFLQLTDRFFLRTHLDLDAVAVYAIGYKVGSLVNLVLAPFRYAWPNFAFSSVTDPDAKKIYRDVITFLILGSLFVSLGTYTFRFELINLLSPESYQDAASVVPWISAAMVLYGLYPVMSLGPKIMKKTAPLAWLSLITTVVNIILLILLVPIFGMTGAAVSVFLSYIFLVTANYVIGRRYYYFPLDWKPIALSIGLAIVLAFFVDRIRLLTYKNLIQFLCQLLILLIYPAFLILLKIIPLKDIINILSDQSGGKFIRK